MTSEELTSYMDSNDIPYQIFHHEPIFTVAEGEHLKAQIAGAHSKNLFMKDKKGQFFLLSLLDHKQVDLKALSRDYGKRGLSFAKAEDLMRLLRLLPGSVTPYGLLFDTQKEICFLLDEDFLQYPQVNFHPMRNDRTIRLDIAVFLRFFDVIEHPPIVMKVPEK